MLSTDVEGKLVAGSVNMLRLPLSDHRVSRRGLSWGIAASVATASFYAIVLSRAAGIGHLADQAAADWPWLVVIVPGFGIQTALLVELRALHAGNLAVTGAGSASSAAGMVACCAHHLAELLPIFGMAGFAGFLTDWKPWFLAAGVGITLVMVFRSWRQLAVMSRGERHACAVAS